MLRELPLRSDAVELASADGIRAELVPENGLVSGAEAVSGSLSQLYSLAWCISEIVAAMSTSSKPRKTFSLILARR